MHLDAKKRITAAIDEHAKDGKTATQLRIHPDYARELSIHGTHLDWNSETLHPTAEAVVGELTHEKYDERVATDPHIDKYGKKTSSKPKSSAEAVELAKDRDHSSMRRDVVLEVVLDEHVPNGKMLVAGVETKAVEKEA